MRIGHYAPKLWMQGGIASYVHRLGEAQASSGHSVHYLSLAHSAEKDTPSYIALKNEQDLFAQARSMNLDILHLHKPVSWLPQDRVATIRTMHGNQGSCPSGTRYLARKEKPCDRVYSVGGCLWGHLVDRCAKRRPKRIKASFESINKEHGLATQMHTITVSSFLKEQMVRSGCQAEHIHTLLSPAPNVAGERLPISREEAPRFLFVGRIVPEKGVAWLLQAAARVPDVRIDIAGSGYFTNAAQRLSADLGINERVTFHGWVRSLEVESLMKKARAVIVPSIWHEPAGLATLEAAAHGRPVIASQVGGIPEYAQDAFAIQVAPNDIDGLAKAMTAFSSDIGLAEKMGQEGWNIARARFSMQGFLEKLDGLYKQVINASETPEIPLSAQLSE